MDDFINTIGTIGFTALSILFAGLSAYFSLKRRHRHNKNNCSKSAESDRNSKIDYRRLKDLYSDSIKILSKKDNDSSDNSSAD